MICVRAGAGRSLKSVVWGSDLFNIYRTSSLSPRCSLSAEDCGGLRAFSSQSSAERLRRGNNIFNLIFMDIYLITIFSTVVSGTFVFVAGQIILKFFIEPIHKQKEVIGEIADTLIYYVNLCAKPMPESELKDVENSKKRKEASKKFRKLGSQLSSKAYLIPHYKVFSFCKIVVKKENIVEAKRNLIGLSNCICLADYTDARNNFKRVGKLDNLLGLGIYTEDESIRIRNIKSQK